ncbi:MAG TPA: co-chaperone YbbN [Patescibacteria group bacterium]|nr:co-chaperone YbbN [Patescibacteria group bacterium]
MFARSKGSDKGDAKLSAQQPAAANDVIFDVGTADFEARVLQASLDTPILVDFWAPWCGPCKQLGPILEAAVKAANGKVRLAKVNIDDNPQLAQALRVQSVPTVYAFFHGQPVNAFAGARPQSEVKLFIDQLVKLAANAKPDAIDIPAALKQAAEALAKSDIATAQNIYASVLEQDEKNAQAYAGLARTFVAGGHLQEAQQFIASVPPDIAKDPNFAAAVKALELAMAAPKGNESAFRAALEKNPADHQARFDLALTLFAAGKRAEAVDELVEIIRRNRTWEEEKARKQLITFFEAMGPADPETLAGRRKLSSVLFS